MNESRYTGPTPVQPNSTSGPTPAGSPQGKHSDQSQRDERVKINAELEDALTALLKTKKRSQ